MPHWTNATSTGAGILRPAELAVHATVERVPCAAALSTWVENYWFLEWAVPAGRSHLSATLPHPACTLSVERGPARAGVGDDRVVLTGVITRRFDVSLTGRGWVLGVKFRPGGLAALAPIEARQLADRTMPAVAVLPDAVCHPLRAIDAGTPPLDAAGVLDEILLPLVPDDPDPGYDTVLRLIRDMLHDRSLVRVSQLGDRHAISRRHVERLFARYVGVGPKWVLARYRLHDAIALLDDGYDGSLTDLAAQFGWYDQAHFIRDFVGQVGVTPGEYRAGRAPS